MLIANDGMMRRFAKSVKRTAEGFMYAQLMKLTKDDLST
jgi:hypothetical protein